MAHIKQQTPSPDSFSENTFLPSRKKVSGKFSAALNCLQLSAQVGSFQFELRSVCFLTRTGSSLQRATQPTTATGSARSHSTLT